MVYHCSYNHIPFSELIFGHHYTQCNKKTIIPLSTSSFLIFTYKDTKSNTDLHWLNLRNIAFLEESTQSNFFPNCIHVVHTFNIVTMVVHTVKQFKKIYFLLNHMHCLAEISSPQRLWTLSLDIWEKIVDYWL